MSNFKFFEETGPSAPGALNKVPLAAKAATNEHDNSRTAISARYRCEQFNTTKVEDNINFHCSIKKQYLLENGPGNKAKVVLEQFLYKINPEILGEVIEATQELEYDKENVQFTLNNDYSLDRIENFSDIQQKWEAFKPKLRASEYFKTLLQHSTETAQGIIEGGNIEFGSEDNLKKTYDKSLFYHIIFNDYDPLKDRPAKQKLQFISQIFVNIPIELELTHGIIQESEAITEIMTVGKLNKEKLNHSLMVEQYNKFYKPVIEYDFTEYVYEYIIRRTVNNKTGLITSATAKLTEAVKYNYQTITQFDLKLLTD